MARDPAELWRRAQARKREPAVAAARALVAEQRFDEAERCVLAADDGVHGHLALAELYRERLRTLVQEEDPRIPPATVDEVFRRARSWAFGAFPEPHTAIEAEERERYWSQTHAALVSILGRDPTQESLR